jgi:hypothetical protein
MFAAIYQRNILATMTKYILLKPPADSISTSKLATEKKEFSIGF